MQIAIIGAGNVGSTLGQAWARLGHLVTFGVRQPEDARFDALRTQANIKIASNSEAVSCSDVVAFSTPWQATQGALESCGDLSGKVVIDCTNPLKADFSGLELGHTTSGAEMLASWAKGAHVVKAMNQIGYGSMDSPDFNGRKPVMFVCGENAESKGIVLELVEQLGFEAIDSGALKIARLLEPFAMLWIHCALNRGLGVDFGFGILRKRS